MILYNCWIELILEILNICFFTKLIKFININFLFKNNDFRTLFRNFSSLIGGSRWAIRLVGHQNSLIRILIVIRRCTTYLLNMISCTLIRYLTRQKEFKSVNIPIVSDFIALWDLDLRSLKYNQHYINPRFEWLPKWFSRIDKKKWFSFRIKYDLLLNMIRC